MQFVPGILGAEAPIDGGFGGVALGLIGGVKGGEKTYHWGGGMLYYLDDACWLWSDRR